MKKLISVKKSDVAVVDESIEPRGIHHTISYATSFQDTWDHIRHEIRSAYANSPYIMPEERAVA